MSVEARRGPVDLPQQLLTHLADDGFKAAGRLPETGEGTANAAVEMAQKAAGNVVDMTGQHVRGLAESGLETRRGIGDALGGGFILLVDGRQDLGRGVGHLGD